jgi:hypothetical protein
MTNVFKDNTKVIEGDSLSIANEDIGLNELYSVSTGPEPKTVLDRW